MNIKCINPSCGKEVKASHYGKRQKVCGGTYTEDCRRCPAKHGKECKRCNGTGKYDQSCRAWYRTYWAETRKPPRGIPDDVFKKIKEEASKGDSRKHALLVVARETGLRKGEVLGLTWSVVLDHNGAVKNSIELRGQWSDRGGFKPTKSHASRLALLSKEAREVVEKLKDEQDEIKGDDRLFPFWESATYNWFVSLQTRLGITNPDTGSAYRFHDLRHALGSELVRGGRTDLAQKMLGHKNINTTMGYAEQRPDEMLDDLENMKKKREKEKEDAEKAKDVPEEGTQEE